MRSWPSSIKKLNYVINQPRVEITLNLYEAERYEPAIIVQSLIGNLVYYSNQGRYVPRLAKSWRRTTPKTWRFEIMPNLVAENGEAITPSSFKASIERTLRFLSKSGPFPVLCNLIGYSDFVKGARLAGLKAEGNELIFDFDQPVRDGILQVLSFAPFGYISAENLNPDGSWKDDLTFISSGPYRVDTIDIGNRYLLSKRPNWAGEFAKGSPDQIEFTFSLPKEPADRNEYWIVDAFTSTIEEPEGLARYPLVPEYINPILLGRLSDGYFSNLNIRRKFKHLFAKYRAKLPEKWGAHIRSQSFYPSQALSLSESFDLDQPPLPKNKTPLIIEGEEPIDTGPRGVAWQVLRGALEEAGLPFKFANNKTSMKSLSDESYDIRLRGASIGGGAEAWGLKILFQSDLGPRFPDPSGRVRNLIESFDRDAISEEAFAESFGKAVDEDAAIIPISHYGIQLYLSPNINRKSLNPTVSIVRFDRLVLD